MKEMSQKMAQAMDSGEMEQMQEDAKLLRQILDNLLAFSFDQEFNNKTCFNNDRENKFIETLVKVRAPP